MIALGNPELLLQEKQTSQVIAALLDELPERARNVVKWRLGFEGEPRTLEDIAQEIGTGRERVRQLEAKAIRLLKHPSRSRRLRQVSPLVSTIRDDPPAVRPEPVSVHPIYAKLPPKPDSLADDLHRQQTLQRIDRSAEAKRRSHFPRYAEWLQRVRAEPLLPQVGPWEYWDFGWPFELGMSPTDAVNFAIRFNGCSDQNEREKLCELVRKHWTKWPTSAR